MLKWENRFSIQSVFQKTKVLAWGYRKRSVKNFCSSKVETMPSTIFFRTFDGIAMILCWAFQLQHRVSLIYKTHQTRVRLQTFLRVNSFSVITCCKVFSSYKISCSSQSGSFLRSSRKGLRMKEKFTTRLTLNFAKVASSHFF